MSQIPVPPQTHHEADVVIVGLGPVGLFAALLLGRQGHSVIGIERWPSPYPLPRAVTFDHEIARILASVGIDADSDPAIDYHDDRYLWINAAQEVLTEIDWLSKAPDGWRNRYWFGQPELEARLREIISSLPNVTLLPGNEAVGFEQDDQGVTVSYEEVVASGATTVRKEGGARGNVRARFAIGSDGANSFIRRVTGREYTDLDFFSDWLVVDVTPDVMPEYMTAHFQICDTARPTTVVPAGPGRRRWEFMALPDEDLTELGRPEKVWELLAPWGISPDNANLDRAVVWRFQAKYVEDWRANRALLAGDAAHLMPPFAGEGMCAGLRDIVNLIWRLDLILNDVAGLPLLDEWVDERREQAKWYIEFSVGLGRIICVTDPEIAAERDTRMKAEHELQSRLGPVSPHDAVLGAGTWYAGDPLGGRPSIQGRVEFAGRTGRFDDAVGRVWFLLSSVDDPSPLDEVQLSRLAAVGGRSLTVGPAGSSADIIDLEDTYIAWFGEHGINHLLVRPDFYVAATGADAATIRARFESIFTAVVPVEVNA